MCVEGTEPISSREASAANCLALSSWCFGLFWDRISCSPGWLLTILCSMTLNSFPYSLHVMGLVRFYVIHWIFKGICFVFVGCECVYVEIRGQVMEVFFYHEGPRDQTEFVKFVAGPLHMLSHLLAPVHRLYFYHSPCLIAHPSLSLNICLSNYN